MGQGDVEAVEFCPLLRKAVFESHDTPSEAINLILNGLTSIAAICGNLLVLLSIWSTPSLHSPSHVLLFGLAMADFAVGLLAQPVFIVYFAAKISNRADIICTSGIMVSSLSYGLAGISFFILTAISLDRFLALQLHLRYRAIVTTQRVVYFLVSIWVFGASFAVLGPLLEDRFNTAIIMSTVVASVCICLMSFWYVNIFRLVRRHQRQIQNGQTPNSQNMVELRKSSLVRFSVCCLFLLCYVPFVLVTIWQRMAAGSILTQQIAFEFSSTTILTSSCLNPILYCWRLRTMRTAFRQTLRKYCC